MACKEAISNTIWGVLGNGVDHIGKRTTTLQEIKMGKDGDVYAFKFPGFEHNELEERLLKDRKISID